MILEHIVQCTTNPHCACGGIVGLGAGHTAAGVLVHFVDPAYIQRPGVVWLDLFNEIPIAIIDEQDRQRLSGHVDGDQAVPPSGVLRNRHRSFGYRSRRFPRG